MRRTIAGQPLDRPKEHITKRKEKKDIDTDLQNEAEINFLSQLTEDLTSSDPFQCLEPNGDAVIPDKTEPNKGVSGSP